jgi:pimeloyl-ACP methyl ester carboxylesterase
VTDLGWILIAVAAAVSALVIGRFWTWRTAAQRRALGGSQMATTSRGPVEYATVGKGPAVLLLHGGLGGFDQGLLLAAELGIGNGSKIVCPSRAGYLRTPLATCSTPEETADAVAELLESLHLANVVVVGVSGGGPTALQFTLRHPRRVRALVMVSAISRRHEQPDRTRQGPGRLLFSNSGLLLVDFVCWALVASTVRWRPSLAAQWFIRSSETHDSAGIKRRVREVMRESAQVASIRRHLEIVLPLSLRKTGLSNDLSQFARLPDYPIERVSCPTLVVHGRLDGNVPLDHAEFVAGRVPEATLRVVEDCGHFFSLSCRGHQVRDCVVRFLDEHAARQQFDESLHERGPQFTRTSGSKGTTPASS